jgi:hypothetical protein
MADRMAAEIHIGGKVPRELVSKLCAAIAAENVSLEWGGAGFRPAGAEDILRACSAAAEDAPPGVLCLFDDQARWGEMEDLERFLEEHQIAFNRFSEGKYEQSAEVVRYRPQAGRVESLTDPEHRPVVLASSLEPVEEALRKGIERLADEQRTEKGPSPNRRPGASLAGGLRHLRRARRLLGELVPPRVPALGPLEIE